MAMKIKGIFKSFKFISQIFAVKERELEIGHPTDVKHVAHIGWDSPSITAPTWMNEFRTSPNLATSSSGNTREPRCSNQDMEEPVRSKTTSINSSCSDYYNHNHNNASKKSKSRKTKSISSTPPSSSSSSSSTRRSRAPKSKLTFSEATPTIQV